MTFVNNTVVVNHSLNITNSDAMTVIRTTTESVTITLIQTTTASFTVYLTGLPSPSPTQSSDTAGSTSCSSSDTDNIPIYVAVAIVIVGLLITITVVVGVILCHRYWQGQEKPFMGHTNPLIVKDKTKFSLTNTESDLHGGEGLG